MNATAFLEIVLTTKLIEGAAASSHNDGWFAAKQRDLKDPANPFQGFGLTRIRVRDLDKAQRFDLGIHDDAEPSADVYHPLFRPFAELDEGTKAKNIIPLMVLCYGLGDFMTSSDPTLDDLRLKLEALINGVSTHIPSLNTLARLLHVAFMASELRAGARPYGPEAREDFGLYSQLHEPVQALDAYTLLPAARWLLEQVNNAIAGEFTAPA